MTRYSISNHDSYYDPPDEPETYTCEVCGEESEENYCTNPQCPNLFEGDAKQLAEDLAEARLELKEYKLRVKILQNSNDHLTMLLNNE